MTLLLRKFDHLDRLIKLEEDDLIDPPLWLIKAFLPEAKEGGTISVFEVDNDQQALEIASAFGMLKQTLNSEISFLSCEKSILESTGLKIETSDGDLHHHFANAQHRDLYLSNANAAITAAIVFIAGTPISFPGKIVQQAAQLSMRNNLLHCKTLAGREDTGGRHLLKFIRENVAILQGIPTS